MTLKRYQYSILKYRPSYFLGEEVNIGLLFWFIEEQQTIFIYPQKLARLSHFYPNADPYLIRTYLKSFEKLAKNYQPKNSLLDEASLSYFLLEDASSFYFSEVKKGGYHTIEQTLAYYQEAYFHVYAAQTKYERKDEKYLNEQFLQALGKHEKVLDLFHKGVTLRNKLQQTKFDFAWQNGSTNCVKSISFDLKEKDSIQNKSFRWFGELTKLGEKAKQDSLQFDLLISKPQSSQLIATYKKALQILDDIDAPKRIIEEHDIENYVNEASQTVKVYQGSIFD